MSRSVRGGTCYRVSYTALVLLSFLGCASGESDVAPNSSGDTLSYEALRNAERARIAKEDSLATIAIVALIRRGDTTHRDSVLLAQDWIRRTRADLGRSTHGRTVHRIANDIYLDSIDRTLKSQGTVNNLLIYQLTDPLTTDQQRRFAVLGLKRVTDRNRSPSRESPSGTGETTPSLIESDASINVSIAQVEAAVVVIRSHGYTCSSVSGAWPRPYSSSRKLKVICNGSQYSYELRDVGGIWIVDAR